MNLEMYRNREMEKVKGRNQEVYHYPNGYGVSVLYDDDKSSCWEVAVLSCEKHVDWTVNYNNEVSNELGDGDGMVRGASEQALKEVKQRVFELQSL